MKRLKHYHIFKGKSSLVLISVCAILLLTTSVSSFTGTYEINGVNMLTVNLAAVILTVVIDCIIINHLRKEEREKIKNSRPPEWKRITKKIKKHFREDIKSLVKFACITIIAEVAFSSLVLIRADFETMLFSLAVLIPATLIIFTAIGIYEHFWANMDDSAKYTRIKIDHSFYGERTKSGRREYIVFYLPDGKYVLETTDVITPKEIIVIKYKGFIRWENSIYFT